MDNVFYYITIHYKQKGHKTVSYRTFEYRTWEAAIRVAHQECMVLQSNQCIIEDIKIIREE